MHIVPDDARVIRFALSGLVRLPPGTPIQNNMLELFSILNLLDPEEYPSQVGRRGRRANVVSSARRFQPYRDRVTNMVSPALRWTGNRRRTLLSGSGAPLAARRPLWSRSSSCRCACETECTVCRASFKTPLMILTAAYSACRNAGEDGPQLASQGAFGSSSVWPTQCASHPSPRPLTTPQEALAPVLLRRMKEDVEELPQKEEVGSRHFLANPQTPHLPLTLPRNQPGPRLHTPCRLGTPPAFRPSANHNQCP